VENGPSGIGASSSISRGVAESTRVVKNGGKIMKDKFSIGQYGYIALVTDTEGNIVGLHSMK